MSMRLLGAMAGASGQALEAIKSRQDDEREVRRARMLEELRRDTATYLADYQDRLNSSKANDKQSGFDPTTGEFIGRNDKGEELFRRKDAGLAQEYADKREDQKLQRDMALANIEQSKASADSSRASADASRKRTSLEQKMYDDKTEAEKPTLASRAGELMFQNKVVVDDLIASGVPAETVQRTAQEVLARNAASGKPASQAAIDFTQAMAALRYMYKDKSTNPSKVRKSLDE